MANKKTKTSKEEAMSTAEQQHVTVTEFLNQEPTRTALLQDLVKKKGKGKELTLLTHMLKSKSPVSSNDMGKYYDWPKSTASVTAKNLDTYLQEYSNAVGPLKAKRKKICIPRQVGGINIGYHFACLDTKAKVFLDALATRQFFENLWDDFIRNQLRRKLEKDAADELSKKLQGRDDYQPLGIEIGVIPDKTKGNSISEPIDFTRSKTYGHNRKWQHFDIDSLFTENDRPSYIISVDAGGGKTTFLRHLQIEFLQKSDLIPVFLDASKIEQWNLGNTNQLAEKLADVFDLDIPKEIMVNFLARALKGEIILLVDGLDQIKAGGSGYESLANHILALKEKNLIIASRPSAIINQEDEDQFTFLRLRPFDIDAQINFFRDNFERAKQLSHNTSISIAIPMLAQMIRTLIEVKQDKAINNRTQLYEKFIGYILTKYKHGKAKLDPGLRTQIKISLEKIAYYALAEKEPHIQKIPLDFCYEKGLLPDNMAARNDELLTKSGLVNLILEQSGLEDKDFLFFTHQSFQEFFAAKYAVKDDCKIKQIMTEKWNTKWKEVIKFLTGITGQEVIERILSEKDNPIHSKLFLAAELVPDARQVDNDLRKKIAQKVERLLDCPVIGDDAEQYWLYVEKEKALDRILRRLNSNNAEVVIKALYALTGLGKAVSDETLEKIVYKLEDKMSSIRQSALKVLVSFESKIDNEILKKMIRVLEDKSSDVRDSASYVLGQLKNKINGEIFKNISCMIDNENPTVCCSALKTFKNLNGKIDDIVLSKIVLKLESKNDEVCESALSALWHLSDKIDSGTLRKIVCKLKDKNPDIVCSALNLIVKLKDKLDGDIKDIILRMLKHQNIMVRNATLTHLCGVEEIVDSKIMNIIGNSLEAKEKETLCSALWVIRRMEDKVKDDIIKKIACNLDHEDGDIRAQAIMSLQKLEDKIDDKIIAEIIKKIDDEDGYVCLIALHALVTLKERIEITPEILDMIDNALMAENPHVCSSAIYTLGELADCIDIDTIGVCVGALEDEDSYVRRTASETLTKLKDNLKSDCIEKIAKICNKEAYDLLKVLYSDGKLEFITKTCF